MQNGTVNVNNKPGVDYNCAVCALKNQSILNLPIEAELAMQGSTAILLTLAPSTSHLMYYSGGATYDMLLFYSLYIGAALG